MASDGHRAGSELFVCFPSRTTMSLMPKPILSPGRNGDPSKRVRNGASRGQSSPMFSIPSKKNSEYQAEEPTSPKVTCAGQVRVKPSKQCKSWQSVMAEIEKLHSHKQRRRVSTSSPGRQRSLAQVVGFKKDLLHFVTALRNLRVDFGCFGAPAVSTDDDDEEEEEDEEEAKEATASGTFLAKWFMMLQDNDDRNLNNFDPKSVAVVAENSNQEPEAPAVPPPNALLLMRCRSAPSRASLDVQGVKAEDREGKGMSDFKKKSPPAAVVLRRCEPDFAAMLSMDVSKETWVNRRDFNHHSFLRSVSLKG
ncbi:hypothetical protein SUGI_1056460 [Cryptomeria japonica]|uniref:uncharacterized protein LOC131060784 n=1 Tax=Cryptomeria japonica TaxID=3369 RepID=UPI002414CD8C|nr:uncharacterized protein LOC131060784 [Cryptomeria japonica]GLJ49757.1 hypothetical protein SUGI_1056460 [Cryptomeria japonica]